MKSLTPGKRASLGLLAIAVVSSLNAIPIGVAELPLRERPRLEARAGKCAYATETLAKAKSKRQSGKAAAKGSRLFRFFL
jgi:hypothetical protein